MKPMNETSRRDAAFTAIEITAVATIIAILALLILPLLRGRVDEAKLAAAQDDLNSLVKAQTLVNADTGQYVRIQDLDNTSEYDPADPNRNLDKAVPHVLWNRPLTAPEREALARVWKGPYTAAPRNVPLTDLINPTAGNPGALGQRPEFYRGPGGAGGPVLITDREVNQFPEAAQRELIPIDPWGNPYLFFGPGRIGDDNNPAIPLGSQTDFSSSVVYSFGPDGLPGDGRDASDVLNYYRETGALGESGSDDLKIFF